MIYRPRRLRKNETIRNMVAETSLQSESFIYPLCVQEGQNIREAIPSLCGQYRFSVDRLAEEVDELRACGVAAVLLFGVPLAKDWCGSSAYDSEGIVQRAARELRRLMPELYIISDICMCEYTDHGHCGILTESGYVDNDRTLEYLQRIAVSHAQAGVDMVAPSDMMDGRVGAIRTALDEAGFINIPIMAYSAKYASSFYSPFRDAVFSAPAFGDRKSYQMDFRNSDEAMREIAMDIEEGADIVMVKPALINLDIIRRAHDEFNCPLAAYSVSGEYAMLHDAIEKGHLPEKAVTEVLTAIRRAGAKLIITYDAKFICKSLRKSI